MNIPQIIQYLYPDALFLTNWQVGQDDDGNQFISFWDYGDVPQPTMEQLQAAAPAAEAAAHLGEYKQQALAAFPASDITVLRCVEHGIAIPADWVSYRAALRAIISAPVGTVVTALPVKPPYPSGS
ncbi:XkdW family protein [Paraburkholderia sp. SIMBA_054]|uniref:XkdW family protein n=1 Tax=Paraburkholderia sp. SIMBA_054 TaxID=3085795 RepID=UPI00397CDC53